MRPSAVVRSSMGLLIVVLGVFFLTVFVPQGATGTSEQVPIGARAMSMGGAFSAVASDGTALFWNPAGLAQITYQEITAAHANLYDSGIKDNYAAFVLPLSRGHVVAGDWYHSGFDDDELAFGENRFDLSYGFKVTPSVSLGLTGKLLTRGTDLDGVTVRDGKGVGMDLGILASPLSKLRLGLVAQDLFDTKLNYSGDDGSAVAYPRNVRFGASYTFGDRATIAADIDDRYHLGGEFWVLDQIALRAGMEDDRRGSERAIYSFGTGLKVGVFRVDYAYVDHPVLGSTNHFTLSMAFNFNPSLIRIEEVNARDLYISLHKNYVKEPVGTVRLSNLQDRPLTAKLGVFVSEIMDSPSEREILLRPKATQEFPLTLVLPQKVMNQTGDRPVQVNVSATYQSHRLVRAEKGSAQCVAYGPGAIDWGEGVAQVAAFVTTQDPVVDAVARGACTRGFAAEAEFPLGNRTIGFAAAVFDALAVLGVTYVPDPYNPYSAMAQTPHAVDTIHYPRQTIQKRSGDCDDTCVLMAALLGNVGIPTKLVDVPGHLFLLVGTGIHERNRLALGLSEDSYVISDEEVWIPLETTALGKGFSEAWRIGAESYSSWASRGQIQLVDVAASQARYEPAELPAEVVREINLETSQLRQLVARDTEVLGSWRSEYLATRYGETSKNIEVSMDALNELGRVYLLAGKIHEAHERLKGMLVRESESARAHNNLAAVFVATGNIAQALEHYSAAAAIDPTDPGIWLNMALVRHVSGDTLGAEEPLEKGVELSGGYLPACKLLGLPAAEGVTEENAQRLSLEEIGSLLKAAFDKVPSPATRESEKDEAAPTEPEPAPGTLKTRVGAGRAGEEAPLYLYVYWKE
ncbi:MAG: tetratricopeptide repeat protein [Candidatus Eiseniibacteriota bacterium]|nr:MAG: tetratricopeptide repeat protein [Candidatus Eisenbacteria bacterium]